MEYTINQIWKKVMNLMADNYWMSADYAIKFVAEELEREEWEIRSAVESVNDDIRARNSLYNG
jgi:uncharacterized protein YoaH (UPF0181 family)